jgi:Fe2+ transport system protein FeoA
MDEKGTIIDEEMHIRLTSVRPGKTCRLVGVNSPNFRDFSHRSHRKRKRRFGRGPFKHQDQWELREKKWGRWKEKWEEGKKEWHQSSNRGMTKRLLDLGFTKGCTFKVVHASSSGPILVEVRGTRIALGHELASRIIVEVLEEQS